MNDIRTNLKNTIDLAWIYENERQEWLIKNGYLQDFTLYEKFIMKFQKTTKFLVCMGLLFIVLLVLYPISETNANKSEIMDNFNELEYYWVDNHKDLARKYRIEACYITNMEATEKQLTHCATMMALVTAIESDYMQSPRCKNDKNCTGIKGWQNWKYWFMKFESVYEHNLYFAEKFWKYHYKKSLFTFVYWYKQNNWSYKYGWTYTQQDTYLQFLRNNYEKVYWEIERI